ncbi:MAG: hypothetical protein WCW03_03410 [Candidatus Paceibacterota bacterium]|jgi:hypothetical protein
MSKFINISNIRRDDQKRVMEKIATEKHCPFCSENIAKYHKKPIIKEGKYWILTDNQWPYEKVNNQLLAIHKTHIEHLSEMDPEAGIELIELFKDECNNRNIPGGGLVMRFGSNPEHGTFGNSVLHLHAHLIEPNLDALDDDESWKFSLGKGKHHK